MVVLVGNFYVVGQSLGVLEPFWVVVEALVMNEHGVLVDLLLVVVKAVW